MLLLLTGLCGCSASHIPKNQALALFSPELVAQAVAYAPQEGGLPALAAADASCPSAGEPDFIMEPAVVPRHRHAIDTQMRTSIGDRLNISTPGAPDFGGDFVINADGRVFLPMAGTVQAAGLTNAELTSRIKAAFIKAGIFKADSLQLIVRPIQYAPITIPVSGAVFQPGLMTINIIKDSDKSEKALSHYGDAPLDRFLATALRAAGGIRPDADVSRILVTRGHQTFALDWRGAFTGKPVDDIPLMAGDRVFVPETPCFQSGLVRPTQITPQIIKVAVSNNTLPSVSGGTAMLANTTPAGMSYGTRLLPALVAANCVGGSLASNAQRHAILITRNPKTRRTEVIQRSVEELVQSAGRDAINPFLMPDDSIACYDSSLTDVRETAGTLDAIFGAGLSGRAASKGILRQ